MVTSVSARGSLKAMASLSSLLAGIFTKTPV